MARRSVGEDREGALRNAEHALAEAYTADEILRIWRIVWRLRAARGEPPPAA